MRSGHHQAQLRSGPSAADMLMHHSYAMAGNQQWAGVAAQLPAVALRYSCHTLPLLPVTSRAQVSGQGISMLSAAARALSVMRQDQCSCSTCMYSQWPGSSCSTALTQHRWWEGELVPAWHAAGGVRTEQQRATARALHQRGALVAEPAACVGEDGGGCGAVLVTQHALGGAAGGQCQQTAEGPDRGECSGCIGQSLWPWRGCRNRWPGWLGRPQQL